MSSGGAILENLCEWELMKIPQKPADLVAIINNTNYIGRFSERS